MPEHSRHRSRSRERSSHKSRRRSYSREDRKRRNRSSSPRYHQSRPDEPPRHVATAGRGQLKPRRSRSTSRRRDSSPGRSHGSSINESRPWSRDPSTPASHFGGGRGKGGSKGAGRGYHGAPAPLPRPGYDDDTRLQALNDDPRYFAGAELGKAQKAAMGIVGLTGRNTASFDPKSTLVRPAMRIYYGPPQKKYKSEIKVDDVIIVPDFYCSEESFDVYDALAAEMSKLQSQPDLDVNELEAVQHVVSKMCRYFKIDEQNRGLCLAWYRNAADDSPLIRKAGKFRDRPSKGQNCLITLAFGSVRELAFRRTKTNELLFLPQSNGALSFFGSDVCARWQYGMNMCTPAVAGRGHISVSIMGVAANAAEETTLALGPCDENRGEDVFDGRGDIPCLGILRPSMRIITAPPRTRYTMPVKHDDCIVVPEFFCAEDDWDVYYQLLKEMRQSQANGEKKAEWLSWHEGAHLLSQNPTGSPTYHRVLEKMCDYFSIAPNNRGTRFNWYRDGSDWKPFHHDSAAFNPQRARSQNCTIGISFGASRDLAFRHAKTGELLYFPQKNGMLFYFGRDANIVWQHGINALPDEQQDGKGRISIILWGLCTTAIEEKDSPPMLDDSSREGGKGKGKGKPNYDGRRNQPCRDFQRGTCNYGDRCRFSHSA